EDAAGHLPGGFAAHPHLVAVAREGALLQDEPGQPLTDPLLLLPGECVAAQEIALVELDDPPEPRLERRVVLVQVVAVQDVADLETQRVAGPEADGEKAVRRADLEETAPDVRRVVRRDVEFEAILARVPGPADDGPAAIHL